LNTHSTFIKGLDHETYLRQVYQKKRGLAVTCPSDMYLGHNKQIYAIIVTITHTLQYESLPLSDPHLIFFDSS